MAARGRDVIIVDTADEPLLQCASRDAERVEHHVQHDARIDAARSAAQVREPGSEDKAGGQKRDQPVAQGERSCRQSDGPAVTKAL